MTGRGRPRMDPEQVKRAHFTSRLRTATKLALREAAHENGRSLSEEIEFRLEQSLWQDDQEVEAEASPEQTVDIIREALGL